MIVTYIMLAASVVLTLGGLTIFDKYWLQAAKKTVKVKKIPLAIEDDGMLDIPVQVNGVKVSSVSIEPEDKESFVTGLVLSDPNVLRVVNGRDCEVVYVPKRIVNVTAR
jgi:leucyl-tRNA synthetase